MPKVALIVFKYSVSIHDPCCFPLGFMYVSSELKHQGFDVTVFNENIGQHCDDLSQFDAVYMTGFEEFLPRIKEVAEKCKQLGVKTILGGSLATNFPIQMNKIVDTVWIGEFEQCGIDETDWPDYDGFGIDKYNEIHDTKYMGVLTSRGCPFSCTFCSQTVKFRERNLGDVFSEIRHYKRTYGAELIIFNDNTLNIRKDRFLAICKFMGEQGLQWSAAIRVDRFDEEMAKAAKESGCKYFVVGVESFDQKKLDRFNKKITVRQISDTLDLLHAYDIDYHGNIILGCEGDTMQSIEKELMLLPITYNIFPVLLQPFAGIKAKTGLSDYERDILQKIFENYANSKGMQMYRSAE